MILRSIGKNTDVVLKALSDQFGDKYLYCWNNFKHDTDWALHAYHTSLVQNKDIMCAETPLIGRQLFNEGSDQSYYRVGINVVSTFLHNNYFIPNTASPDRFYQILENSQTKLKPWRSSGDHIIYAMQVPGDTSLSGLDVFAAAQYDLIMLRKLSNRPIIVALHPDIKQGWGLQQFEENKKSFNDFKKVVDITNCKISTVNTNDLFNDAWCTVCHTSGISFDSIVNGVPTITLNERSFMRPITSTSYYDIDNPLITDRIPWLSRIAYCQWNLSEINTGVFKAHIT